MRAHACKRPAPVTTTFSNSGSGHLRELRLYAIKAPYNLHPPPPSPLPGLGCLLIFWACRWRCGHYWRVGLTREGWSIERGLITALSLGGSILSQPSVGKLKGAQARYFELFWTSTKLLLKWRKPENNALQRQKNTKEITTKHKGTRMVKYGEDWRGLKTTKLKSLAKLFKPFNRDWAPLISQHRFSLFYFCFN